MAPATVARSTARRPAVRFWPLLPALLFLGLAFVYPVALLIGTSVVDADGAATAEHYTRLYTSPVILRVLAGTLKIAFWTTLLCAAGAYPVAYLLANVSDARRNTLLIWVLMPFWTSFLVRTFGWLVLLGQNGPVNQVLALMAGSASPRLLYNLPGVIIAMVHALMPLCVLTTLSVMRGIDRALPAAAATLGARPGAAFLRIYFPLSLPGIAAGALLVFITALGFFITPALLGSERETMIVQVVIFQIQQLLNFGFGGAIAVLLLAVALAIFHVFDRLVGLSALAGDRRGGHDPAAEYALARLGRGAAALIIAALARLSDLVERGVARLVPSRADRPPRRPGQRLLQVVVLLCLTFLAVPAFFVIPLSVTDAQFLGWPPRGFSLQWYERVLQDPAWIGAAARSFTVAGLTGLCSMALGVPAAFYLARRAMTGRGALLGLLLAPIIMPNIIIAVALFYLYARIGLVGTNLGLVVGHTVLALPYVVVTMMAVLKHHDERIEHAAYTLGANRTRTFLHVTLPLLRAGLVAAFMFAFIVSFDELTIALFVTGGIVTTLPKKMWDDALLHVSPTLAAVATLVLLLMTVVILLAELMRRRGVAAN